jgi:hypothetical protein
MRFYFGGRSSPSIQPAIARQSQWIQIVAFRAAQRARAFAIDRLHDHLERIAALAPDGGGWKYLAHGVLCGCMPITVHSILRERQRITFRIRSLRRNDVMSAGRRCEVRKTYANGREQQ